MCGKPLVYWTVAAACGCAKIDKVYVATDSEKIRETLLEVKQQEENEAFQKLEVIGRSAESASDRHRQNLQCWSLRMSMRLTILC